VDGTADDASGAGPAISVRSLGAFELCFDGRPVERWKAGKARSLLQFLLLRPGRIVPRGVLYEALWPEAPWSKDSSSLKVAAHMLRSILKQHQSPAGSTSAAGPALRLLTRESGYKLEADRVSVDFETFTRLADRAHAAQSRGDQAAATALYREAVSHYHGDFLPEAPYHWAAVEREWLRSWLLCALDFLIEAEIARADPVGVLHWCRRMLADDPLHEPAYRALILVHAHLGQLTQVNRWYDVCTGMLRDRLQTTPTAATRRLYTRAAGGEFTGRPLDPRSWRRELQAAPVTLLRTSA
jgi:DNA-binding SARP family transcriptional activator